LRRGRTRGIGNGIGMPYPRVIAHSDGAGQVDQVGEGVSSEWIGRPVWCYGAQSYRPFGTAGELCRWIMSLSCRRA
jgi:NADPH:quinone reductase-like Zn-dependent oxidoreductase